MMWSPLHTEHNNQFSCWEMNYDSSSGRGVVFVGETFLLV